MFIMSIWTYSAQVFSLMSMLVTVPSAKKVANWSFTMQKGPISFDIPMPHALAFTGLFTMELYRSFSGFSAYGHSPHRCETTLKRLLNRMQRLYLCGFPRLPNSAIFFSQTH